VQIMSKLYVLAAAAIQPVPDIHGLCPTQGEAASLRDGSGFADVPTVDVSDRSSLDRVTFTRNLR